MNPFTYVGRTSQRSIYEQLRTQGSSWIQSYVLFADRQVIVINKPPDLVCQLDNSDERKAGLTFLNSVFRDIKTCYPIAKPYPAHRLDKMTTGCYAIPIRHSSAKTLSKQFKEGTVEKSYLALVRGGDKSFPGPNGRIEAPLLYKDGRPELHSTGKKAITEWEVLSSSPKQPISLVKLNLMTGNKHQLRMHLSKVLQTPILGDTLYSQKPLPAAVTSATSVPENRLFLHASDLSFFRHYRHNGAQFRLGIRAPVPTDFQRICRDLDINLPSTYSKASILIDNQVVDDDLEGELALFYSRQRSNRGLMQSTTSKPIRR